MTEMTAAELDKWRWQVAHATFPYEPLGGFDPRRSAFAVQHLNKVIDEYRKLVVEDQRPAKIGKVK